MCYFIQQIIILNVSQQFRILSCFLFASNYKKHFDIEYLLNLMISHNYIAIRGEPRIGAGAGLLYLNFVERSRYSNTE